ncbi:hypothetical protein NB504_17790 [Vibrio sp. RM-69-4]|nr:hypothetical protein [Vibrio sp. RM-69-4]
MEIIVRKFGLLFVLFFASFSSISATLVTENYVVLIESNCIEGNVTCDDVTYTGKSKRSGNEIILTGHTLHTYLSDGTPSRFIGYEFVNGDFVYVISDSGLLTVTQDQRVLVKEQGNWDWSK